MTSTSTTHALLPRHPRTGSARTSGLVASEACTLSRPQLRTPVGFMEGAAGLDAGGTTHDFHQDDRKRSGAYYTPLPVADAIVRWAVREATDCLLDPSAGDGRFIAASRRSYGVEQDGSAAAVARRRAPWASVHHGEFFSWASQTGERFEAAVGNPPFIRYQHFDRGTRARALDLCGRLGAKFNGLASSWAPFLVATASLLKPGGRMGFIVPAEIGHAPYAKPLVDYLVGHFETVHVVAVRERLFPGLSEDCWLLFADGYGGATGTIRFSAIERFDACQTPPTRFEEVSVTEWRDAWNGRLRPFLAPARGRATYQQAAVSGDAVRLGAVCDVGIGYITGANGFFHLRRSEADRLGISSPLLQPTVRNGRFLQVSTLTRDVVRSWLANDDPVLLLRLATSGDLSAGVKRYLDSEAGREAQQSYKCRIRDPWFSVPDVRTPEFFLSCMSGVEPRLARNAAGLTCTNTVLGLHVRLGVDVGARLSTWVTPFARLSCEFEGHPLGGGVLKLEPREAARVLLPKAGQRRLDGADIEEALWAMRSWRHCRVDAPTFGDVSLDPSNLCDPRFFVPALRGDGVRTPAASVARPEARKQGHPTAPPVTTAAAVTG